MIQVNSLRNLHVDVYGCSLMGCRRRVRGHFVILYSITDTPNVNMVRLTECAKQPARFRTLEKLGTHLTYTYVHRNLLHQTWKLY